MGSGKENPWVKTLRQAWKPIKKQINNDLGHLAQKTHELVDGVTDVTIHESHRQQAKRYNIGNLRRVYLDATSGNLKRESLGREKLHEIVGYGENQIPPKEVARIMKSEYGDFKAADYFENRSW